MKPINLTPKSNAQQRMRQENSKTPYIVIGVLVLVVIASFVFVTTSNQVSEKQSQLATAEQELSETQAKLTEVGGGSGFATLAEQRSVALHTIGEARFDWSRAIAQVGAAVPTNAWLIGLTGKVNEDASTGETSSVGSQNGEQPPSTPGPSLQLIGCSYKQSDVARMISRLRAIDGVDKVLITSSNEKDDASGSVLGGSQTGSDDNECRTKLGIHKFNVTLAFAQGPETALAEQLKAAADAAASETPASATPAPAATTAPTAPAPAGVTK